MSTRQNMFRNVRILAFFILLISFSKSTENAVSFQYGFIGQKPANPDSLFLLEDGSALNSGDQIKLNFEFEKGTYSYVVHLSSQKEYGFLYSSSSQEDINIAETIFTTLGWIELDDQKGDEIFYLISTNERLVKLEDLLEKYDRAKRRSKKRFYKRIKAELDQLQSSKRAVGKEQLVKRLDKLVIGGVTFRGKMEGLVMEQSLTHKCEGNNVAISVFWIIHE